MCASLHLCASIQTHLCLLHVQMALSNQAFWCTLESLNVLNAITCAYSQRETAFMEAL